MQSDNIKKKHWFFYRIIFFYKYFDNLIIFLTKNLIGELIMRINVKNTTLLLMYLFYKERR